MTRALRPLPALLLIAGCASAPPHAVAELSPPADRIVFLGDSLVHRSDGDHGLLELVRRGLEERERGRRFELWEAGRNGDRIADLRKRLDEDVLARHPSAVVLYWDSDVSDVDEEGLTPSRVAQVRAAYESDLAQVLGALLEAGAYVIVTGPTLIGERPHGQNPKDAQLDAYAALNRHVAAKLGAHYLDSRRAFLHHEAMATGALTEDGEHLSAAGVRLLAGELLKALRHWLHREEAARP